jgi:hypothetical protein
MKMYPANLQVAQMEQNKSVPLIGMVDYLLKRNKNTSIGGG